MSTEKLRSDFVLAASSSPIAFLRCVDTWLTDFREDLKNIDVPSLIIQGDQDRILPLDVTGKRMAKELECELKIVTGGSHGIPWTHADVINEAIINFLRQNTNTKTVPGSQEQNISSQLQ